jgi:hypothetical protein
LLAPTFTVSWWRDSELQMVDLDQMSIQDLWTFYEDLHAELIRKTRVEMALLEQREGLILAARDSLPDLKSQDDPA